MELPSWLTSAVKEAEPLVEIAETSWYPLRSAFRWLNPAPDPPASANAATPSAATPTTSAAKKPFCLIPLPLLVLPRSRRGAPAPGQWRRGVHRTYVGGVRAVLGSEGGEMRLEHRFDRRRAGTPLDAVDDALALHEHQGGDVTDPETLRELGLLVDVHPHDPES